jgi:hypothetical protein
MLADAASAAQSSATAATQWLTLGTLFTAAGATTAVIVVTSVLQGLIPNLQPKWFALALSFCIALLSIEAHGEEYNLLNVVVAIVNGFLTYAAAVGVNNVITPGRTGATGAPLAPDRRIYRWWP